MGRILVVEDDLHIAEVLTDLLEDEGYQVATGVNGNALIAALNDPPALILLDVMMPGMDGIEFCRQLKANQHTKGVPVVFVDPADTSRTCPECGHCAKANRKSRDEFECRSCGHRDGADHVGALNVRDKGRCQAA